MTSIAPLKYRLRQWVATNLAPRALALAAGMTRPAEMRLRRTAMIFRHVRGAGIEVGALASPAILPPGCRVTYVDKYGIEAYEHDPALAQLSISPPDVLDDAETLARFMEDSQDFVLAFHVAEHVQNPMAMLRAFHRVTRDGGTIILAVPERTMTADRDRPITTLDHLVEDDELGPERSFEHHVREVGSLCRKLSGEALDAFVDEVRRTDGHVHFHVWDAEAFLDFIWRARARLGLGLELLEFGQSGNETLVALRVRKRGR